MNLRDARAAKRHGGTLVHVLPSENHIVAMCKKSSGFWYVVDGPITCLKCLGAQERWR